MPTAAHRDQQILRRSEVHRFHDVRRTCAADDERGAAIEGAERAWLDGFARALRLDRAATEAIERRIRGG